MARKMTKAQQAEADRAARQKAWDEMPAADKLALRIQSQRWTCEAHVKNIREQMDSVIYTFTRAAEEATRYRDRFVGGGDDGYANDLDYANWFIGQAAQVGAGITLGTIAGAMAHLAMARTELKALEAELAALTSTQGGDDDQDDD